MSQGEWTILTTVVVIALAVFAVIGAVSIMQWIWP